MKTALWSSCAVALGLCLFASCDSRGRAAPAPPAEPGAAPDDPGIDLDDPNLELAAPLRIANLVVWPVTRKDAAAAPERPDYLTLDEALETGVARVLETGEVQELRLVNDSDRPVLLLAGEVLQGGKQDRIVAQDLAVGPGVSAPLGSFCVEQGRWHATEGEGAFASAKVLAAAPVRGAAQVTNSQSAVWSNVAFVTGANAAASSTGAYLALASDEELQEQVAARAARVLGHLGKLSDVVGLVAAVDWGEEDEAVAAEIFGDAALFGAYRDKLVRTYCLDSVTRENWDDLVATGAQDALVMEQGIAPQGMPLLASAGGGNEEGWLSWGALGETDTGSLSSRVSPDSLPAGVREVEGGIEAGNEALKHLHRTIYKTKKER